MKTAWISKDERYPDYLVRFVDDSDLTAVKVQLTKNQVSLARRFKIIQSQYEAMCEELFKPKVAECDDDFPPAHGRDGNV